MVNPQTNWKKDAAITSQSLPATPSPPEAALQLMLSEATDSASVRTASTGTPHSIRIGCLADKDELDAQHLPCSLFLVVVMNSGGGLWLQDNGDDQND
jgi:hypothetical protein